LSEDILIDEGLAKEERYKQLLPQIKSLVADETDVVANMANICAVLKYNMPGFFWVGFYIVEENDLVVGPYQGPLACTRIQIPNGVCGAAARQAETIIVPEVNKFPGHIACSSLSKSEIVVPIVRNGKVFGVLDVDSESPGMFDEIDEKYLGEICGMINFV
jgi:GAF domain-containing protein